MKRLGWMAAAVGVAGCTSVDVVSQTRTAYEVRVGNDAPMQKVDDMASAYCAKQGLEAKMVIRYVVNDFYSDMRYDCITPPKAS